MSATVAIPKASLPLVPLTPGHQVYLEKRGILSAAKKIGVHSTMDRQRGRPKIALVYAHGWLKLYDPTKSDDPWRQQKPKNARLPLWDFDKLDLDKPWAITEGEWDRLAGVEAGFDNITSLPDGSVGEDEEFPAKSGKLAAIREAWPRIAASRGACILAMDNDANGQLTRQILIEILGAWRCRVVEYPRHPDATGLDGRCKDLNEVLLLCGKREVLRCLREAKPVKLEGVFRLCDIPESPKREFLSPGIPGLERYLKPFRGGLLIVTAHTGHGKTTALLNILGYFAQSGLKIGLGTFEADVWNDIVPWYEAWLFGENPPQSARADTIAWLDERFTFISPNLAPRTRPASMDWFIQQGRDARGRHGLDVLVLEPWNKIAHLRLPGESETEYVGRALGDLYAFANASQVLTVISAHPNKATYADGYPRMPTLGDVSGSMNFGNAADHFLAIWRPDPQKTISCFSIQKRRVKGSGRIGRLWCSFNEETNRYSPLPPEVIDEYEEALRGKKNRR
ncbi:MAG: bifunctional DNA primase/helicase [Rhodomicrobium sp.]